MESRKKILLVEDDESLGYLLTEYLRMKGFEIKLSKNGITALKEIEKNKFDLAILDVMMPEMDGFTLAEKIKSKYPEIPFIFLTARSLKIDVLKGFYLGAIDYLKKPIDEEELVVRINTLLNTLSLNKLQPNLNKEFKLGKYRYQFDKLKLTYDDKTIKLTSRENDLLHFFVLRQNKICTHKEILDTIWGKNDYFTRKSLNVFISRLRNYLEAEPSIKIKNIHNQGFIFRIDA
jgi:DNA-binding response OmpR family regulator